MKTKMHNVQTMKTTKDKTTNEDSVGKTRFLSLMKTLIETSPIAHEIQYQLILLDSLSLSNKCLNTFCGLGNSRDPNTLSDLLRDYFASNFSLGELHLLRPLIDLWHLNPDLLLRFNRSVQVLRAANWGLRVTHKYRDTRQREQGQNSEQPA